MRAACRNRGTLDLTGAVVYSSCEPCAVCHAVAATAGVTEIVYAATREMVPDLDIVAPNEQLMAAMQAELRALAPHQLRHLEVDGADEPFRRLRAGA